VLDTGDRFDEVGANDYTTVVLRCYRKEMLLSLSE